ncbi:MAG: hypothetical protein K5744_02595 [Eubacterium sp.]|nr:hypothetical protein [Eubacterium sp.]
MIKKIAAAFAAVCMTLSMGLSAVSADTAAIGSDGKAAAGTSVSFQKVLRITNPEDGVKINVPAAEFKYETSLVGRVEIPEGGSSETGTVIGTAQEPAGNYIASTAVNPTAVTVSFPGSVSQVAISGKKAEVSENAEIDFSVIEWKAPGVYRFRVKEERTNKSVAYNAAYTDLTDEESKRYIDVYVNAVSTSDGSIEYQIAGYVFLKAEKGTGGTVTYKKTTGYTDDGGNGGSDSGTSVTIYETYNLTVKKVIKGTMAKASDVFNFTVSADGTQEIPADMMTTTGGITAASPSFNGSTQVYTTGLKGGDSLAIKGIAKYANVTVKESDQDAKNYKTEITSTGSLDSKDETARTAGLHMDTDRDVTYTNTSSTENVTPTGIVRMVAPYLMIVVMALLLAVVFFRSKKTETID